MAVAGLAGSALIGCSSNQSKPAAAPNNPGGTVSTPSAAEKPKTGGIESLAEYFPRIRKAYLIGQAAQEFAATLDGKVPYEISETLDAAVPSATRDAAASGLSEPVVLLSPACASYDMFRSYVHRAGVFVDAVAQLARRAG